MGYLKQKVRLHQIYKAKRFERYVEVIGKKKDKWLTRVLTPRPNVFNGSHTLAEFTISKHYDLVDKSALPYLNNDCIL